MAECLGGVRWCGRVFGGSEVVWPSVWGVRSWGWDQIKITTIDL